MPHRRLGRRGVAGFFEEIPAAAVAIISLLLFFSGVLIALTNYSNRQQSSQFSQEAQTFLEGLLGYANLTYRAHIPRWTVRSHARTRSHV